MSSPNHFQVDLNGLISLLSDHLYSGPEVYIRELLQNAVDALTARAKMDQAFRPEDSTIRIEVVQGEDVSVAPKLVVTDEGVGLTEDEVHRFLATIGKSSKREFSRDDFIGQFGIGLLSGFIVSEEIVVITRSIKPGSPTLEWKGRADGTYVIRKLDFDQQPGTSVYLRAKPGCFEFLERNYVSELISRFGSHLPIAVELVSGGEAERLNTTPPWGRSHDDRDYHQDLMDYGSEAFGESFIDCIPLEAEASQAMGVAWVLAHASRIKSRKSHRAYLKGMLVSDDVSNLLPEWAFFVRTVVNAKGLRPTANRESFHEDDTLAETRYELGRCIKQYFVDLAENDPAKLNTIIALHHLSVKAIAAEDDEFFDLVINWLPFETSLGTMSLQDYRQQQESIRYVRDRDEFRQIAGVAAAQRICIIDAAYTYDEELLAKLDKREPKLVVEKIDISELAQEFGDLTVAERNGTFQFLEFAEETLQAYGCKVELKRFEPQTLPALYTLNSDGGFLRSIDQSRDVSDDLWDSVLESVAEPQFTAARAQLCLNFNNPLIERLIKLNNKELLGQSLEMLYVQSLLLGHYPLRSTETSILTHGLIHLIDAAIGSE